MAQFGPVLTAVITPFAEDGSVDYQTFSRLCQHLVANGSDGVVVTGTTGESPTLSDEEKLALYKAAIDAVGSRATVIAGTGTYDTAHSVELTERACELDIDGVLVVAPYYSRPDQRGFHAHFTAVADASTVPVMLYNIPARTGRLVEIPTLVDLARHERITAVKDAVDDAPFTGRTIAAVGDALEVYSGSDDMVLAQVALGAVGVVSVASHIVGNQIAAMIAAHAKGDVATAAAINAALFPIFDLCFTDPNPTPVKGALSELWEPVGSPRLPLVDAKPETVAALVAAVRALA